MYKFSFIFLFFICPVSMICFNKSLELELHQKLTVMVSPSKPFVIYDSGKKVLKGLDIDIIENFAKRCNLTIDFLIASESLNEVFATENSFEHFPYSIRSSEIDIFIGGLDGHLNTNKHLIATRPYHQDSRTWCIQRAKRLPAWKNTFYLCRDPLVYVGFCLTSLVTAFAAYFFQQFEPYQKWDWYRICINGVASFFGFACSYNPQHNSIRLGFIFHLFSALIFSVVLSSAIVMISTTVFFEPQFKTVEEIIAGKFIFSGDRLVFARISEQTEVYPLRTLREFKLIRHFNESFGDNESIKSLKWNDHLAIATSHELSISRALFGSNHLDPRSIIYCFDRPDNVYEYFLNVLMQKNFPYQYELNKFIQYALEGGLIVKWQKDYRFLAEKAMIYEYVTIDLKNFFVVGLIYLIMSSFAIFMLISEKIIHKKVRSGNAWPIWRYLEMSIDPNRYFLLKDRSF